MSFVRNAVLVTLSRKVYSCLSYVITKLISMK